jgi:hypothetical protein
MPDFKKDKKKTKSVHDSAHPVYEDLYEKIVCCLIFISFLCIYRFEWVAPLVDIRRQHLAISVKNNFSLFTQEQTYMGDVCVDKLFCL